MDSVRVVTLTEAELDKLLERAVERALGRLLAPRGASAPEAVSIKSFAESKGISEATVRRMMADGLPTTRVGRRGVRIPLASAETWLANRRRSA